MKCKICGDTIEFDQGTTIGICVNCGIKQTLPALDDIQKYRKIKPFETDADMYQKITEKKKDFDSRDENVSPLLKRIVIFLEDGDWSRADEYSEKVLDQDPENAEAYLGKLMAELHVKNRSQLADCSEPFDDRDSYKKIIRFGDEALVSEIGGYITHINFVAERKAEERRISDVESAKKLKKVFSIVTPIVVACIAFLIILTSVIIPNSKYNTAISLIENGEIIDAYESLIALNGYKDSAIKASEILDQYKIEKLKNPEVGDIVYFGNYEQDDNISNGKESIEWIVLAINNGKALLISKYGLDCHEYNLSYTNTTWEECSLRTWMNRVFLNNAFSADDKAKIATTYLSADKNPTYKTSGGNMTKDNVFLLSISEAEKYFKSNSARECSPTSYAKAKGDFSNSFNGISKWWVRSPGCDGKYAAYVDNNGSVSTFGFSVTNYSVCIRPALWIDIEGK